LRAEAQAIVCWSEAISNQQGTTRSSCTAAMKQIASPHFSSFPSVRNDGEGVGQCKKPKTYVPAEAALSRRQETYNRF